MAQIILMPGKKIEVVFFESDGVITVAFNETSITVNADLPDATGREGLIYNEEFGKKPADKDYT